MKLNKILKLLIIIFILSSFVFIGLIKFAVIPNVLKVKYFCPKQGKAIDVFCLRNPFPPCKDKYCPTF